MNTATVCILLQLVYALLQNYYTNNRRHLALQYSCRTTEKTPLALFFCFKVQWNI
jgi:hypothetical protein